MKKIFINLSLWWLCRSFIATTSFIFNFGSARLTKLPSKLGNPDLLGSDVGRESILGFLELAEFPHLVNLLSHFRFLFLDGLEFAGELKLGCVQLAHFLFLGIDVGVDFRSKVDTWNTILLENVLDHEEDQLVGLAT